MFSRIKLFAKHSAVIALVGFSALSGSAQSIVSPGNLAGTDGAASNFFPFSPSSIFNIQSMRYQQVYNASDFASLTGPMIIRQIAFRPSDGDGSAFMGNVPDIQINLSTTSNAADGLSVLFSNNVGADDTVVYARGALDLNSAGTDLGGFYAFDIVVTLTTPFTYDPSKGNLLLDVRNYSGSFTTPFDAQNMTDSISRIYAPDVMATTGSADSLGLATQFMSQILRIVTGTVTLEGSVNPALPVTLRFDPVGAGGGTAISITQTLTPTTGSSGTFSIGGVPAGQYRLNVKAPQSLAASGLVDLTGQNVDGLNFLLGAGDANGDNVVDVQDFEILVGAYGSDNSIIGSDYDVRADFNNDGLVDVTDFSLIVGNYGMAGAN